MEDRASDLIRSFAMSGYLVTDELKAIERRYNIELSHTATANAKDQVDYYPQFEHSVRSEAAEMSSHYEVFYNLEKSIRKLISETLSESEGSNWWDSGRVPPNIVKEVSDRAQRELDSGVTRRSDEPIDYTTFGELSVIITSNWNLFGTVFDSRRAIERVMSSLNLLRGPIAHCCPISDDEVLRLRPAVKDWFRMIG
jgi:hypothetical protein